MQTFVMTGATRGIGREALRRVIEQAPDLALVLMARAGSDLSWVDGELAGRGSLHRVELDLDSMQATARAARQVVALVEDGTVPPVTALVLNAGVQHVDANHVSADGLEDTFAVNVVANHILVQTLAPHMVRGGRVIITVSDTHFGDLRHNLGMVPGPVWRDPDELGRPGSAPHPGSVTAGRTAYSTSKLAAIHQVHEYARRHPELSVWAYNPGFVPGTGLARNAGSVSRFAMAHLLPLLARTPIASNVETAGRDLADLAIGRHAVASGSYVNRDRAERSSSASYDPPREAALVDHLDQLTRDVRTSTP